MAVTPFREQVAIIINGLFMQQVDLETALDEDNLTTTLNATADGKEWFKISREYRTQASCTGEDTRTRKVKTQIGTLSVIVNATPEQAYGIAALARGTSAVPVNNNDGTYSHASARLPAYNYNLPGTTFALAFSEQDDLPVKILKGVKVDSYELIGAFREFYTMRVTFVFHPEVTDASGAFVVPACTEFDAMDMEESQLLVDGVDTSVDMFDGNVAFGNNMRRGTSAYTNNSKNPTRLLRGAQRSESMTFTLTKNVGDALYKELEAGTDTNHAIAYRAGSATKNLTHSYPVARLEFANDGAEFSGDDSPFVVPVRAIPLASGGVTSNVTGRNTTSAQYLPVAA